MTEPTAVGPAAGRAPESARAGRARGRRARGADCYALSHRSAHLACGHARAAASDGQRARRQDETTNSASHAVLLGGRTSVSGGDSLNGIACSQGVLQRSPQAFDIMSAGGQHSGAVGASSR